MSSGSSRSASSVEPTTSQNSAVMTFRSTSRTAGSAANRVPQLLQKRAAEAFPAPHVGQIRGAPSTSGYYGAAERARALILRIRADSASAHGDLAQFAA
jgi:hypothetical protein